MDKQQAQRAVFQLRRKAVNSAPKAEPVNRGDGGVKPGEAPSSPVPEVDAPLSPDETIARLGYRLGRQDQQRFVESACRKQLYDEDLAVDLHERAMMFPDEPVSFSSIVAAVKGTNEEPGEEREPLTDITGCDV